MISNQFEISEELLAKLQVLVQGSVLLIKEAVDKYGVKLVYPTSLGITSCVLIDLIYQHARSIKILTIDTGKLPSETLHLLKVLEKKYSIKIERVLPDEAEVQFMVKEYGSSLYTKSVSLRKKCCEVRKVKPLRKTLEDKAWLTGRRFDQSSERSLLKPIEYNGSIGLVKFNPLLVWTSQDIWNYIRKNDLPYNKLYDRHYYSIGCEPCTRSIAAGEDERAGRWWWENGEAYAECGLHLDPENKLKKGTEE